jgi:hypothetical protein
MTQSASGSVNVSWERARVSTATRERKPKERKLLVFMSLWVFCFACTLQAWCNVGATCGGLQ